MTDYWRLYQDGVVERIIDSGESVRGQFSRIGEVSSNCNHKDQDRAMVQWVE